MILANKGICSKCGAEIESHHRPENGLLAFYILEKQYRNENEIYVSE